MNEKADLRRLMKRKLAALGAEMFENQGIDAAKRIGAELFWKKARTVLLFVSMPSEISTCFLMNEALSSGKTLFVPRIIEDDLAFFRINTLDGPWDEGPFGIFEPKIDNVQQFQIEKVDCMRRVHTFCTLSRASLGAFKKGMYPESNTLPETTYPAACGGDVDFPLLVIVPGLAFDKNGHRLGRGKGYYDRFLSKIRTFSENNAQNIMIMGLCLEEQLVDHVPTEEFDEKVDALCTGKSILKCIELNQQPSARSRVQGRAHIKDTASYVGSVKEIDTFMNVPEVSPAWQAEGIKPSPTNQK